MASELPTPPADRPAPVTGHARPSAGIRSRALYPSLYVWFVFLAALDLLFTWVILALDGREVNLIAEWVIQRFNIRGIVLYKFGLVVLVVLICEVVGRMNRERGEKLAHWAIALTLLPVLVATGHMLRVILQMAVTGEPIAIDSFGG